MPMSNILLFCRLRCYLKQTEMTYQIVKLSELKLPRAVQKAKRTWWSGLTFFFKYWRKLNGTKYNTWDMHRTLRILSSLICAVPFYSSFEESLCSIIWLFSHMPVPGAYQVTHGSEICMKDLWLLKYISQKWKYLRDKVF